VPKNWRKRKKLTKYNKKIKSKPNLVNVNNVGMHQKNGAKKQKNKKSFPGEEILP
jgi:hypothetical protein